MTIENLVGQAMLGEPCITTNLVIWYKSSIFIF